MRNPLRGIVLADLHARRESIEANLQVLDYAESVGKERGASFLLVLGDLLHDRVSLHSKTWIRLRRRLKSLSIPAIYLKGNHDCPEDSYESSILEQLDWPGSTPVLSPTFLSSPLPMVLYPYDSSFEEDLKVSTSPLLLGAHVSIFGSKVGPEDWEILSGTDLQVIPEAPLRLFGHHHKHQWLDGHTAYVGAPFPVTFGEANEDKVILEIEWDESREAFQCRPLIVPGLPRYYQLRVSSPEDWDQVGGLLKGNRVRVLSEIPLPDHLEREWKSQAEGGSLQCLYVPPPLTAPGKIEVNPQSFSVSQAVQDYLTACGGPEAPLALSFFQQVLDSAAGEHQITPGHIELLWVRLQNFGPHVDSWFSLQKTGLVGIEGANVPSIQRAVESFSDEMVQDSNQAGKSHIFDAIVWALTGETVNGGPRDSGNDLIRIGSKSCRVTLAANIRGHHTELSRGRPKFLSLTIDGEEIHDHDLESVLSRHLGFGKTTLVQIILLGQRVRSLLHFLDLDPAEQRRVIDQHVGMTAMEDWIQGALDIYQQIESGLSACQTKIDQLGLASAERVLQSHLDAAEKWDRQHQKDLAEAEKDLQSKREGLRGLLSQAENWQRSLQDSVRDLAEAAFAVEERRAEWEETQAALSEWESYERDLSRQRLVLQTRLDGVRAQMEKLDHKAGLKVCPECQQPITPEHVQDLRNGYLVTIRDMESQIQSLQSKLDECSQTLSEGRTALKERDMALSTLDRLSDACRRSVDRLEACRKSLSDACSEEEYRLGLLRSQTNPHMEALGRATEEVERIQAEVAMEQETLSGWKLKRSAILLLLDTLGYKTGKGVKIPLYTALQSRMNDLLDEYCSSLSNNRYSVQVWLTDKTSKGEVVERYRLVTFGERGEIPQKRISGGQLRRMNIAFILTLRTLFAEVCGVTCNFLGIDEAFDGLDQMGKEAIAALLPKLCQSIDSVWAISQEPQLQRLFSRRLVCLNAGGVETIVVPRGHQAASLLLTSVLGARNGRGESKTKRHGIRSSGAS
jgi:energy-coupling factor transporter ATP-binding protein EcfA2